MVACRIYYKTLFPFVVIHERLFKFMGVCDGVYGRLHEFM